MHSLRPILRSVEIEQIEPRRHLAVSYFTNDYISDLSDNYFAQVDFGDNGDPNGSPTGSAGINGDQYAWSFTTWDGNESDGVDSSWRTIAYALNSKNNGMVNWRVDTGAVQSFPAGAGISVNSVTLRAGVEDPFMEIDFRSITVRFYSGTSLVETDQVANFGANTMDGSFQQESGAVVTPNVPNCTGVSVIAQVRLQAPAGTYPGPTDMFGQVLVS
jgi:hypothetical protein